MMQQNSGESMEIPGRSLCSGCHVTIFVGRSWPMWKDLRLAYTHFSERVAIEDTKAQVERLLSASTPKTFEQIFQESYYADSSVLSDAIDELEGEGRIHDTLVSTKSQNGVAYEVRVYFINEFVNTP